MTEKFPESNEEFKNLISSIDNKLNSKDSFYLDVEELLLVADYYMKKGQENKAVSVLKIGLNLHLNNTEILFQMGIVYYNKMEYEKAIESINLAQNIDPLMNEVNLLRAEIYSAQQESSKSIENYLLFITNASEKERNEIYSDLAWEYESEEDFENALKYLLIAMEVNPNEDIYLFEIAYFFENLKKPTECIAFFENYIDENPYSHLAWYNLGNIYSDQKMFEKAVEAYDYASIVNPEFASAFFNKGNVHFKLKEYQKSIECYFETFKLEDNKAITCCYVGECYEKLNNLEEAEKYYEMALSINENIIEGLIGITLIKDRRGETLKGLPYIQKASVLHTENTEVWYILGEVYEKLDRIEESQEAYQKAWGFSPKNIQLALDFSNFLAENSSVDEAINLIESMEDIKIKYRLVAYYFIIGKKLDALVLFENCLHENYDLHKELLEYHSEITKYSTFMRLVKNLKK